MKRIVTAMGLGAVIVFGGSQLVTAVRADPPPDKCIAVICQVCPEGYVFAPTPGNCCRCIKVH